MQNERSQGTTVRSAGRRRRRSRCCHRSAVTVLWLQTGSTREALSGASLHGGKGGGGIRFLNASLMSKVWFTSCFRQTVRPLRSTVPLVCQRRDRKLHPHGPRSRSIAARIHTRSANLLRQKCSPKRRTPSWTTPISASSVAAPWRELKITSSTVRRTARSSSSSSNRPANLQVMVPVVLHDEFSLTKTIRHSVRVLRFCIIRCFVIQCSHSKGEGAVGFSTIMLLEAPSFTTANAKDHQRAGRTCRSHVLVHFRRASKWTLQTVVWSSAHTPRNRCVCRVPSPETFANVIRYIY